MKQRKAPIQNKKYLIKRLWQYVKKYKFLFFLAIFMTILSNTFALFGPYLSGKAINALSLGQGHVQFQSVYFYVCLMIIFYLFSSVLSYILSRIMIVISRNIVKTMRSDVFNHLQSLPVSFFDTHQAGEIISTISYDIDTINNSLSHDIVQIFTSTITVFGSFFMMIKICPSLVLVFLVTIPLSLLFTLYKAKRVRPLFRKRSKALGALNGYVEETLNGLKTIKAYNKEEAHSNMFFDMNKEASESNYKADYQASATGPAVGFINNLSLALVSVFGVLLFMKGQIKLGDISSFVLYSRKFSGPINELANIMAELQSALAASERVFNLLDQKAEKEDKENAISLSNIKGEVKFDHIYFSYEANTPIIKDFSYVAKEGSVTAIVGKTGAGKTTLINLLMRFYDIDKGHIYLDNQNIYDIKRDDLRKQFAMVLQDTWLFEGTVYQNLAYGMENISLEKVKEAAHKAHIDTYIESLKEGYDTVLKEGGINISGGQKQLLTIARAMLMDVKMLILDEATSNVDTETEKIIHQAMLNLMKGRTCFVIAHRLSTIVHADQILVLQEGNVVETGSHSTLMQKKGVYYNLYNAQFEN